MKRSIYALILLAISAAAAAAVPATTPAADTSAKTHKAPAAATDTTTAKTSTKEVVLHKGANKPQSAAQAIKRAITVFVPSQKIDVDKAVDFPTNI